MWLGELGWRIGIAVYALPSFFYLVFRTFVAISETHHTYDKKLTFDCVIQRMFRIVPYAFLNIGMLPHQFMSFNGGLICAMNTEFECTPKTASVSGDKNTPNRPTKVKVHLPYVVAELFFFYNVAWAAAFARDGRFAAAGCSLIGTICVATIFWFYGDH